MTGAPPSRRVIAAELGMLLRIRTLILFELRVAHSLLGRRAVALLIFAARESVGTAMRLRVALCVDLEDGG